MSKYVLLVLINIPLLIVGVVSALTHYKTKRISKRRMVVEVADDRHDQGEKRLDDQA